MLSYTTLAPSDKMRGLRSTRSRFGKAIAPWHRRARRTTPRAGPAKTRHLSGDNGRRRLRTPAGDIGDVADHRDWMPSFAAPKLSPSQRVRVKRGRLAIN
ncbi:hypothetical protein HPB47_012355 [Ixodes persulcatus]|uniref:Uncharacterized protein n=1 Tax=Ixodes persulcatus TaxID=34615 RepID=A0AC60NTN9_IXOPE|nr:hypothetical protein HPB47_012355 [Ixodes persulcatus]